MLIGNTAERVLRRLPCSVLTVKPDGFVSPVRLETG
jgi:universal stress protein E